MVNGDDAVMLQLLHLRYQLIDLIFMEFYIFCILMA